jgi:hypothetical protein
MEMMGRCDGPRAAIVGLVSAVVLLIAAPSPGEEYQYSFLFTVPVNVQKMSVYAKEVRLICGVKDANGSWLTKNFTGPSYSNDRGMLSSGGDFSGTLSYAVKLMDPSEASKAKTYHCSIQPGSGSAYTSFKDCSSDTAYFCIQAGTPRTLEVQGTIP